VVGATEHVHPGHDLADGLVVKPEPLHGGAVGVDSVLAVVGNQDRQGDDLLGVQIELAGPHDGLQLLPDGFPVIRVDRKRLPEVRNKICPFGRLDIVTCLFYFSGGLLLRRRFK
jgi:hypothetical protein